jgi:hypothetical protein
MKKKIILSVMLVLTLLLILPSIPAIQNKVVGFESLESEEVLDQDQSNTFSVNIGICSDLWAAQSFIPTVKTLTRVELYLFKYLFPPLDTVISVSIRDSLDGSNLTSMDFVTGEFVPSQQWVEFDIPDLEVVPEQMYYLVVKGDYCDEDGAFMWTAGTNNPYDRGDAWWWDEGQGWEKIDYEELPECDFAFKIYGLNEAPNAPSIDGPTDGIIDIEYFYNISSIDAEGYDVWYYIEWGDGSTDNWIGPFASGENEIVGHTWSKKKTFDVKVKAKDIHGFESDWATIKVTIPKSNIYNWWMNWFERFPLIQKLIDLIL